MTSTSGQMLQAPPSPLGSFSWKVDQGREAFVNKAPLQKALLGHSCYVSPVQCLDWGWPSGPLWELDVAGALVKPKSSCYQAAPSPLKEAFSP